MKTKIIGIIRAVAIFTGLTPAKADDGRLIITTIIGAAAGGVIGSQVGKGDGQLVATATGTLLGAAIGHHIGSQNSDSYYNDPVVYSPSKKQKSSYGNHSARNVQKTVIVKEKTVKHVVVHKYEPDYSIKRKNKHKNKHWKKRKAHKNKHQQVVYVCDQHKRKQSCWKYD